MKLSEKQIEMLLAAKQKAKIIEKISREEKEMALLRKKLENREKKILELLNEFNSSDNSEVFGQKKSNNLLDG